MLAKVFNADLIERIDACMDYMVANFAEIWSQWICLELISDRLVPRIELADAIETCLKGKRNTSAGGYKRTAGVCT